MMLTSRDGQEAPTTHKCGSCEESITRQGTAWGVNWIGPAGNGLCRAAPNGVHWP